jgi:hypothetical protein
LIPFGGGVGSRLESAGLKALAWNILPVLLVPTVAEEEFLGEVSHFGGALVKGDHDEAVLYFLGP